MVPRIRSAAQQVLAAFSKLKTLKLKLTLKPATVERSYNEARRATLLPANSFTVARFLALQDALHTSRTHIATELHIRGVLCTGVAWDPELSELIDNSSYNYVMYRATPSARDDAWCGLDLESYGNFDWFDTELHDMMLKLFRQTGVDRLGISDCSWCGDCSLCDESLSDAGEGCGWSDCTECLGSP